MMSEVSRSPELWKVGEVAAALRMSSQGVRVWVRAGKVAHLRTPGGRIRIPAAEVERLLAGGAGKAEDSPLT